MQIKTIQFVNEIEDIYDDTLDVIIKLDDDFAYVIEVITPQYLVSLMREKNQPFIEPGEIYIIVEKLTPEIIKKAIKAFVEVKGGYWLKSHHFAGKIDTAVFNKLQIEQTEFEKKIDELENF